MNYKKRLDKIEKDIVSSSRGKTIIIDNLKNMLLLGDGQLPKNANIVYGEELLKFVLPEEKFLKWKNDS